MAEICALKSNPRIPKIGVAEDLFEVTEAFLALLGKLPLPSRPDHFLPQLREARAARLPWIHRDPFHRVLIAQALVHGMTMLTADEEIEQYAVRTPW